MLKRSLVLLFAAAAAIACTSDDDDGAPDGATADATVVPDGSRAIADASGVRDAVTSPADAAGAPFGAVCAADQGCASGLCASFGDGSRRCSLPCATADACPAGSQGKKCNGKGQCAP